MQANVIQRVLVKHVMAQPWLLISDIPSYDIVATALSIRIRRSCFFKCFLRPVLSATPISLDTMIVIINGEGWSVNKRSYEICVW